MNFLSPNYQISWFESHYDKELEQFLQLQLDSLIKYSSNFQIYFKKNSANYWLIFLFLDQEENNKLFHFAIECFRGSDIENQTSLSNKEIKELIEISFPYELINNSTTDIMDIEYLKIIFLKNLEENSFRIF